MSDGSVNGGRTIDGNANSDSGSSVPTASAPAPAAPSVRPDAWSALRAHTPARIALGRSGVSLPTAELLRFGAAHAQARDAVHLPLDVDAVETALRRSGEQTLRCISAAPDRAAYLLRPDLGRRLTDTGRAALRREGRDAGGTASGHRNAGRGDADQRDAVQDAAGHRDVVSEVPDHAERYRGDIGDEGNLPPCDLLIVLADGLSSLAAARHGPPLVEALRATVPAGWALGPVVIATQARVALGDDIGAALNARLVLVLIGERPGLSSPDSLGAYLTWAPRVGRTDAERNCVSNIRPEGLPIAAAARQLGWLCRQARRLGLTGIGLKDMSHAGSLGPDAADAVAAHSRRNAAAAADE